MIIVVELFGTDGKDKIIKPQRNTCDNEEITFGFRINKHVLFLKH